MKPVSACRWYLEISACYVTGLVPGVVSIAAGLEW